MSKRPAENPYRPVDLRAKPAPESPEWTDFRKAYQNDWMRWRKRCYLFSFAFLLMCGAFAWPIIAGWVEGATLGILQTLSIASMILAIVVFVFGPIAWFWFRHTRQRVKERHASEQTDNSPHRRPFHTDER